MSAATVVYDSVYTPRITLTRTEAGGFYAVVEVQDLNPLRTTTGEERGAGIESLNPPTVRIDSHRVTSEAHRQLIDMCCRAVLSSIRATFDETVAISPGEYAMAHLRTAIGVRNALRLLQEDI